MIGKCIKKYTNYHTFTQGTYKFPKHYSKIREKYKNFHENTQET